MALYLDDKATFLGSATTTGKLFVIDHYPGMVYHPESSNLIYGDLYGFDDPSILQILDEFEEINISDEYNRQEIAVTTGNKSIKCWSYIYQRNTDALELIPSGDFIFHLAINKSTHMDIQTWYKDAYTCTTDKTKLQTALIHEFLSEQSYWAKGRTMEQVKRSIQHSLCFGIYINEKQVAFARVVTDFTVYAYILDVFVMEEARGNGLGKFLMDCIILHPELQKLKRWMLGTEDAHGLYKQYGFSSLKKVENHMERVSG